LKAGYRAAGRRDISAAVLLLLLSLILFSASDALAQKHDHLTKEEIELVRDVQEIDNRMDIFVRAIERRLIAIEGTSGLDKDQLKQIEKEQEKWGDIPEGSRSEMLSDVDKILDEAIDKLEDVAERDPKSELFAYAVYILADYARVLSPKLDTLRDRSANPRDAAVLNSSIDQCADIVEASSKIPRPEPKSKKKKKKS
jgi:hypothetical protein